MILKGLQDLLYIVLQVLLAALPNYDPPQSVGLAALGAADFILPLSELGLVMGAAIMFMTASLIYTGVMRIVKLVRGAG